MFNSLFWLGIWLLYYLTITDYKGVGLIEAVAFTNGLMMEIPTGAVADLIGRKNSLIIGYLLAGSGNIIMAVSVSLPILILSVLILGPGYGLVSGTKEALIFDSLKEIGEQNRYEKELSAVNKYQLISLAAASILGGYLYSIKPSLPFLLTGTLMITAAIVATFIKEPTVDTYDFNLKNFTKQNMEGFSYMFKKFMNKRFYLMILILAAFAHLVYQVFDNALAIEFGLSEEMMGVFFAAATLINALATHHYTQIKERVGLKGMYLLITFTITLTIIISPFAGLIVGAGTIFLRESLNGFPDILATDVINKSVKSNARATTISTFYMIKGLPYAISAYFIGGLIDLYNPSLSLNILLMIFLVLSGLTYMSFNFIGSAKN